MEIDSPRTAPNSAPRWLFRRTMELAGADSAALVEEYGARELVGRLPGVEAP